MTDAARHVIEDGIARRVFPGAVVEVGAGASPAWTEAFGCLTFDADAPAATLDTVFDLASLTKVVATTTAVMALVADRRLALDERVAAFFPEWSGADRADVTIVDLLEHASGLPARLLDTPPEGRREFEHEICSIPLEYAPRTRSIYSDLDFILVGFLVADRGGAALDAQVADVHERLGLRDLFFPGRAHAGRTRGPAPTDGVAGADPRPGRVFAPTVPLAEDRRRRHLVGEVHDNYAWALGGVAGHAGLFATAAGVGAFARLMLRAARGDEAVPAPLKPAIVRRFIARSSVPGSSRALGWDTMLPTSSCGVRMSRDAFGHVGYTGTSLWIDPLRDRYFVLLTNRACGGSVEGMHEVWRAFHDSWR